MFTVVIGDGYNTLRLNFLQGGNRGEAGDAWGVEGPGRLTNSTYPSTRLTDGSSSPVTIYKISIGEGSARIRLSTVEISRSRLTQTFLESVGAGLTPKEAEYLDSHGNRNQRYDVGDLRAYLQR